MPSTKKNRGRKATRGRNLNRRNTNNNNRKLNRKSKRGRRKSKRGGADAAASGCNVFTKEFMETNRILIFAGPHHPVLDLKQFRTELDKLDELARNGCEDKLRIVLETILKNTKIGKNHRHCTEIKDIVNDIIDVLLRQENYSSASEEFKTIIYKKLDSLYATESDSTVINTKFTTYLKKGIGYDPNLRSKGRENIPISVREFNKKLAIITGYWFLDFCEYIEKVTLAEVLVYSSSKFYAKEILELYKKREEHN